jgi:indolepyruvate ferredoxin oxidoreductase
MLARPRVHATESPTERLSQHAVARGLFKLMACKDEYEVARLYTDGTFARRLGEHLEGKVKLECHLAPPLLAERDPATGHLKKRSYGPWMLRAFQLLAKLRFLRGSALDPFGHTAERKRERALIREYTALIEGLLPELRATSHEAAGHRHRTRWRRNSGRPGARRRRPLGCPWAAGRRAP